MSNRQTRYAVYNINYHIVWIPKYRKPVLVGPVKEKLLELFQTIADQNELEILSVEVMPDHVHLFVSAPPRHAPSWIVNAFKGTSARWLRQWFPHLEKQIRGRLWTRTYYIGTAGTVSADTIKKYIASQEGN